MRFRRIQKYFYILPALILGITVLLFLPDNDLPENTPAKRVKKFSKDRRILEALKQNVQMTMDPALGYVPTERLRLARNVAQKRLARKTFEKSAISDASWTERGPYEVGGRTRALMWDPNDGTGKKVWAGSVTGGMWYNPDITTAASEWVKVNDLADNIAISVFAYDPNNTQIFYAGTGEGWFTASGRGEGIYKSIDGGLNWTQLPSTTGFYFVNDLVVRNESGTSVIYVGNDGTNYEGAWHEPYNTGLWRSADGGLSWTQVMPNVPSLTHAFCPADIEIAADNRLWIGTRQNPWGEGKGTILYSDLGTSGNWTINTTYSDPNGTGRVELACAPSNANVLYAVFENANNVGVIRYTSNKGALWSDRTEPDDQYPFSDMTNGQAWYDLIIQVDPNNPSTVIIGGIDLFKSTNTGTSWTQLSLWTSMAPFYPTPVVHADQHQVLFKPGSSTQVIFGNDGGVFYSANGGTSFTEMNKRYNVTQFYGMAMHPSAASNHFLAGSQDNGSQRFSTTGLGSTVEVTGGDGAYCNIDQNESQYQYTQYVYTNFYRSTNGGSSFTGYDPGGDYGHFINPSTFDNTANLLYAATNDQKYLRWNDAHSGSTFTEVTVTSMATDEKVTALTVSPNTANRLFLGTETGKLIIVDGANTGTSKTGTVINSGAGMPAGWLNCIVVENGDDNHILAVYTSYGIDNLWETTDGGSNWTSHEGDLPDMPVRWAIFHPYNTSQVFLATELGVWSTDKLNGENTRWNPTNTNFANVRTDMIQYRSSDDLIGVVTHGRGLWTTDVLASPTAGFDVKNRLVYINQPVEFLDGSIKATSWDWAFGDGQTSTVQYPTHSYTFGQDGYKNVTLTINGGASSKTENNFIHVLPNRGTPYNQNDDEGGSFDTGLNDFDALALTGGINIWERGVPGNALTTVSTGPNVWKTNLTSDVTLGTYSCALQSPSFNLTNAGTYTLQFRKSMEAINSNAPFGVYVEYSTDAGATWQRLGTDNDPNGTNWYDRGPTVGAHSVTPGGYAFCGNYDNQLTAYDISALAGSSTVCFRFVFMIEKGWTSGYNADGFMLDDFKVLGPSNDASLPVELNTFTAGLNNEKSAVELNWRTESEIENAFWLVERRMNDQTDFEQMAKIDGHGTTSEATDYQYLDASVTDGQTYIYRLTDVSYTGERTSHQEISIMVDLPKSFALLGNYPNPFNPETTIRFQIAEKGRVKLVIYNLLGQQVRTLIDTELKPGFQEIRWDGRDNTGLHTASGAYIYRLSQDGQVKAKKMLLVR